MQKVLCGKKKKGEREREGQRGGERGGECLIGTNTKNIP